MKAGNKKRTGSLEDCEKTLSKTERELSVKVENFKIMLKDLNKIGIALSSEHNLGKLLDMIVREVRRFTNSDGGSLYIVEDDMLSFEIAQNDTFARREGTVPFQSFKIPLNNKSIAGYVATSGNIINISDLDSVGDEYPFSLKTMREFDKKMDYKSTSMLVIPMRNHKDEIIGVIQLINALDKSGNPVGFDKGLEDLVISLSSQAAVAICNSRFILDIKNLFESIVTYSAQAIDARSPHTAGHSQRVSDLVLMQAESLNEQTEGVFADISFTEEELNELRMASLLHDIGKIGVREQVLDKVNKLSDDKFEAVQNRFAFVKRDKELNALQYKTEHPDMSEEEKKKSGEKLQAELDELDSHLALIAKLNIPRYYSDEDGELLESIAKMEYVDINGETKNYIEAAELDNLKVRKGNLTREERKEIESHVLHTLKILEQIPFTDDLKNIPSIAATHHEMLNGTGYPNQIKAKDIPLQARMLAVADIYDALTARDRPYKPPLPLPITLKILKEEADHNRLDKDLVDLFVSNETYKNL